MIDGNELRRINRQATRASQKAHRVPATWQGTRDGFRIQYIGERTPRGWKRTDREPLFVDTSGFGSCSEPALCVDTLFSALTVGKAYGLIEQGQFQGYLAEFVPTKPVDLDGRNVR